ncbi:putative reverse transcriptase domain-containing protein [Tanacetum coccineum]
MAFITTGGSSRVGEMILARERSGFAGKKYGATYKVLAGFGIGGKIGKRFIQGADEELSDGGSPRVIVYGYDGLPMQPVAPPSPDYVPGPEHPPSPDYVPDPEHPPLLVEVPYVPEPEYPKYLAPSDAEAPLEDQPLPADASPTILSPGYVADSDPEEDPEEDHADYPADGGDDDDEPSDDDDDDTDDEDEEPFEDEDDDEEEEEHLALADSSVVPVTKLRSPLAPTSKCQTEPNRLVATRRLSDLSHQCPPSMEATYCEYVCPAPSPPISTITMFPTTSHIPVTTTTHLHHHHYIYHHLYPHHYCYHASPTTPLPVSLSCKPPLVYRRGGTFPEVELPTISKRLSPTAPPHLGMSGSRSSTAAPRPYWRFRERIIGLIGPMDAESERRRAEEDGYALRDVRATRFSRAWHIWLGLEFAVVSLELQAYKDSYPDAGLPYRLTRVTDDDIDCTGFITTWTVVSGIGLCLYYLVNNMPPRRSSATARAAATAAARAAAATAAAATPMTAAAVEQLIEARVSAALANHETLRNSTNGHGDGSHNSETRIRGTVRTPRECTYKDFLNCKPLTFKGTKGVVVLSQWFEKMESVFHISNCAVENQVKFATCTFLGNALTWWNFHMKTVTQDVAYAMDWKALKKMITIKYCPRGEIKKLEIELWNLKVKEEVDKYVGGLPDMIRGNVMSYQPKTTEKAIEFANDQMDQKVLTITERQAEQKRELEFNARNNQGYQ